MLLVLGSSAGRSSKEAGSNTQVMPKPGQRLLLDTSVLWYYLHSNLQGFTQGYQTTVTERFQGQENVDNRGAVTASGPAANEN